MAIPVYEYNASDPALQSQRNSVAVKEDYVNGFTDLIAFEKNTKSVMLSSVIEPVISTDGSVPLLEGVDHFNNRILCISGPVLTTTVDAVNYLPLANFSTNASTSAFWAGLTVPGVSKIVMTGVNSAMVSIGDFVTGYSGGTDLGRLYYTIDNFVTLTEVHNTDLGSFLDPTKHETEDWWLAGAYHAESGDSLSTQTVWGSFDNGATWVILYTFTYGSINDNAHTHYAKFYGDDTVIITTGDGDQSKIIKLTRPDSWDEASVWDVAWTKGTATLQIAEFTIVGDKAYMRREGIGINTSDLQILNLLTDKFDSGTFTTMAEDTSSLAPYRLTGDAEGNGVIYANGMFITHSHQFGLATDNGDMRVSIDGKTWTTVYRSTYGVRRVAGTLDNQIVTNIFNAAGVEKLGLFPMPSVRQLDCTLAEKAQSNNMGLYGVANDNWATEGTERDGVLSSYSGSDRIYTTEAALKISAEDNSYVNAGQWRATAQFTDTAADIAATQPQRILAPKVNDYVVISMDIKYTGYNDEEIAFIMKTQLSTSLDMVGVDATWQYYPTSNGWIRTFITFQCETNDQTAVAFTLTADLETGAWAYNSDVELIIQNVQMYYDTERVNIRSYIPKGVTKDDDYSIAPLTGLGSSWSVTFDWLPLSGNLSFPTGALTTVPIATIQGVTGYIEIYWDRAAFNGAGGGRAFKITDGTNTVSLDADQGGAAMAWLHNDILKFGITSNGTTTAIYCFNPENGAIHGSAILSKSGGAVIDTPAQIDLGSNEDNTVMGTGAFANIRGFGSVLSADEIEGLFNSVSDLKGEVFFIQGRGGQNFKDSFVQGG